MEKSEQKQRGTLGSLSLLTTKGKEEDEQDHAVAAFGE